MGRGFLRWLVVVSVAAVAACGAPPSGGDGTIGGVTVSPATATIAVGETVQLTATLTGVTGNPDRGVAWYSNDTDKATVSFTSGLVTGKAAGTVVITANSLGDPSKSGFADVTVTGPEGADVRLLIPAGNRILLLPGPVDELTRGTPLSTNAITVPFLPCGPAALGPGGRLYVASLTGGGVAEQTSSILVFDAAALAGGQRAPLAVIVSPDRFRNVCGVAFDADGTLWTVNNNQPAVDLDVDPRTEVVGLRGLTGSETGTVTRSPSVAFDVDEPAVTLVNPAIYDLRIDAQGRMWLLDDEHDAVLRYDGVTALPNGDAPRVPDLVLAADLFAAQPAMRRSKSLAVDAAGNLYVASGGGFAYVSRFDGAATRTGREEDAVPNARIVVQGSANVLLVALDADGALWVADDARVARIANPASAPSNVEQVPTRVVTYAVDPGDLNQYGGMTFVPTPSGVGF